MEIFFTEIQRLERKIAELEFQSTKEVHRLRNKIGELGARQNPVNVYVVVQPEVKGVDSKTLLELLKNNTYGPEIARGQKL